MPGVLGQNPDAESLVVRVGGKNLSGPDISIKTSIRGAEWKMTISITS